MSKEIVLVPQAHGGALRIGGPGRTRSKASIAMQEARGDLMKCLHRLQGIRDDPESSADDVCKAVAAIIRLSGIEKDRPLPRKRSTFSVVTATPAEQAEKLARSTPESELAETDPGLGAPR